MRIDINLLRMRIEASIASGDVVLKALEELERLRKLEAADTAWPLRDLLTRLADAAEHLLTAHDCDCHGHESARAAIAAARGIVGQAAVRVSS